MRVVFHLLHDSEIVNRKASNKIIGLCLQNKVMLKIFILLV